MRNIQTVLLEAFIIGLISIVCGYFWYYIIKNIYTTRSYFLPMTINIFLIGFSLHLLFEYTLLNENWCKSTYP
jgi:hypothetical protein